jgi:hypothetical protein
MVAFAKRFVVAGLALAAAPAMAYTTSKPDLAYTTSKPDVVAYTTSKPDVVA